MNNLSKILIVVALIIVVTVVIILKNHPAESEKEAAESANAEKINVPSERTKDRPSSEKEEKSELETNTKEQSESFQKKPDYIKLDLPKETKRTIQSKQEKATGLVLAIVEGEKITEQELESQYKKLSPQYRDEFINDKDLYLEQLIIKELLVQKATEQGFIPAGNRDQTQQDSGIQQLIAELGGDIDIAETELKQFYQKNIDQMQDSGFEQVKHDIHSYLVQQKQAELTNDYLNEIRKEAVVILNEEWITKQRAAKPENPLTKALQNGLPTVLDLGSDTCIPCQMMMPIFDELEKELKGKANVILLQIADYRDLANKYQVRVIPTQIFLDQDGKQYWRHEGFLAKEDIIKKLKETGAQL